MNVSKFFMLIMLVPIATTQSTSQQSNMTAHKQSEVDPVEPAEPPEPPEIEIEFFELDDLDMFDGLPFALPGSWSSNRNPDVETMEQSKEQDASSIISSWISGGKSKNTDTFNIRPLEKPRKSETNKALQVNNSESRVRNNYTRREMIRNQPHAKQNELSARKSELVNNMEKHPPNIPVPDRYDEKLNRQENIGNKPTQPTFISGPNWSQLIKSNTHEHNDHAKPQNQNAENPSTVSLQHEDSKHLNARVLFDWEKDANSKKLPNPKPKEKNIFTKELFTPEKSNNLRKGVQFRFSDIISGFKSGKLFSIKTGLNDTDATFKYNKNQPTKENTPKFHYDLKDNSKSQFSKTKKSKESFKRHRNLKDKTHAEQRRRVSKKFSGHPENGARRRYGPRRQTKNRASERQEARSRDKANRKVLESKVKNTIHNLMQNQMKLNVVKMLFDVEESSEVMPFLMMGVASAV